MNEQEKESGGGGGRGRGEKSASQSSQSKIRKPPPARVPQTKPVVIYMVPPKVIHADASEFMAVVQRLTGSNQAEEEDRGQVRETTGGRREEVREDLGSTGVVEDYHEPSFISRDDREDGTRGVGDVGGSSCFFDAFTKKED